ncbi:MAG: thioredoxin-disulfide reductase [Pseudomonadota bacterium]
MSRSVEMAIVGGGPAGLTAGIYAARARADVLLLERLDPGGQVLLTDRVENYPGFPNGLSGLDLAENFRQQALNFGLRLENAEVQRLSFGQPHRLDLGTETLEAGAVILASGARPNRLGVQGEKELTGKGVSYCATCDGPFFKGQTVVVVGGGDTAVTEAIYLVKFAAKVVLIQRRGELRAVRVLQERLFANDRIQVLWNSAVEAILGKGRVEGVMARDVRTQKTTRLDADGVFIFIGVCPNTAFINPGDLDTDEWGFIISDTEMRTSRPGVFVAGDVRSKSLRQVANAVGEGAVAAYNASGYLAGL